VLLPCFAAAQSGTGRVDAAPPPGFEEIEDRHTILVDLFLFGRPVGSALATVGQGELTFDDPDDVVAQLEGVRQPDRVAAALRGSIDTNTDQLCGEARRQGCGRIVPEVAGVIYDPARFRAEVFVNPEFLGTRGPDVGGRLPDSEAGPSAIALANGAVAGSTGDPTLYNVRSSFLAGYRNGRIRADTDVSSDEGLLLDEVRGQWDQGDLSYAGGLFRTRGLELADDQRIVGLELGTTTDTRLDTDLLRGSEISVYLPRRAQVAILRDGRLLSVDSYPAGNQQLDTSRLPEGAYEVTLEIREPGGGVRRETRFFSKTDELPPRQPPQAFVQVGALASDRQKTTVPSVSQTPALRAGSSMRLTDRLGAGVDALAADTQALGQGSLFFLGRYARIGVQGLAGTDGDLGAGTSLGGRIDGLSYGVSGRVIRSGTPPEADLDAAGTFDPITADSSQASGYARYYFGNGLQVSLRGTWRDSADVPPSYAIGPTLDWNIYRSGNLSVDFRASATRSSDEDVIQASVSLRWGQGRWSGSLATGGDRTYAQDGSVSDSLSTYGDLAWQDRDLFAQRDVGASVGVDRDLDRTTGRLQADYVGPTASSSGNVTRDLSGTEQETRYGGNLRVAGALTSDGGAIGGRRSYPSAVLVRVTGAETGVFDILVDGRPVAQVAAGGTQPVYLPPYDSYQVTLQPVADTGARVGAEAKQVTLYPGNVATLTWEAGDVTIAFGQVVTPAGEPVGGADVSTARESTRTGPAGFFQLEGLRDGEITVELPDGGSCTRRIEGEELGADLVDMGEVGC
jgi:hypothetical protein